MTTTVESVSYACADPLPQLVIYTNSVTNETKTESIPTKINTLQVVFDYRIFHTDDTSFGSKADEQSKGVLDSITDTVNNLFNGENDDKEGKENLIALEKCMADNIWKATLANDEMTWVEGDESQCDGLIIDKLSRRLQDGSNTLVEVEQDEPFVNDGTGEDQAQPLVIDDAGMDQTQPVVIDIAETNQTATNTLDTANTADDFEAVTTFTGTKLIGIDSLPLDVVNTAGCAGGSSSCTSIRGVITASYIGTNENAVSEHIARTIQDGMSSGSILCEGSPAKKLEFDMFVGTTFNGKGGNGAALILDTDRGMAPPPDNLTKYGMLFVIFVALLSVGVIFGVLYKRKRNAKRKAMGTAAERDFEANLELEEGVRSGTPDLSVQSEGTNKMMKMVDMSGTEEIGMNEVELSLSPKSVT